MFNKALALQKERYERGASKPGYAGLCKELTGWRNRARRRPGWPMRPWPVLQQALKDLERAYGNFFAQRAAFPRLKKKGRSERFRYPDPKQIKLDQANSREVLGALKNVTVSARGGKWFVSSQTEREGADPVHPPISLVGVDRGVANFAALSTGEIIAPVDALKRHTQRLARYQHARSRKQKFSRNWI